jgi:hypothetical protein
VVVQDFLIWEIKGVIMDILSIVSGASTLTLVGLLWKVSNGNVKKPECHEAMKSIDKQYEALKEHIDTRIDDLKDYIKKNGK